MSQLDDVGVYQGVGYPILIVLVAVPKRTILNKYLQFKYLQFKYLQFKYLQFKYLQFKYLQFKYLQFKHLQFKHLLFKYLLFKYLLFKYLQFNSIEGVPSQLNFGGIKRLYYVLFENKVNIST